jgi:perosamine synthetase
MPDSTISWFVFVVRLTKDGDRNRVQAFLAQHAIATAPYFAPIHLQPAWRERLAAPQPLPVTESIGARVLALPFFTRITSSQQEQVASSLRKAFTLKG